MKSIDNFNNVVTEDLVNESVDNITQNPIAESENIENEYKEKEVKILFYNKFSGILSFDFDGTEIQISSDKNIDVTNGFITVQYKGTVGTSNFEVKIK